MNSKKVEVVSLNEIYSYKMIFIIKILFNYYFNTKLTTYLTLVDNSRQSTTSKQFIFLFIYSFIWICENNKVVYIFIPKSIFVLIKKHGLCWKNMLWFSSYSFLSLCVIHSNFEILQTVSVFLQSYIVTAQIFLAYTLDFFPEEAHNSWVNTTSLWDHFFWMTD